MDSDLQIAQKAKMETITKIAGKLGLKDSDIELYGNYKAKINMEAVKSDRFQKNGKVILVTAINPTPAGEGKSTTTIGLGDALNRLGKNTVICLREPSLGPVMGVKGGAAGGGYAQVVPMEDINLHFTGDIHAVTAANNLISAVIDNHLYFGNQLNIDPERIVWKRAMDMNHRALRRIQVGLSSKKETPRYDGFDISVASEIMAVLCLARDIDDLKKRIARIVVAYDKSGNPVTVSDLKAAGAATMLLKDAIKPNLVQTLENNPVLIHGGPFANIAHGCNSLIATDFARRAGDYVVTEAGFGADLGMEKFLDIKSRLLGVLPSAIVLVASIRALKHHGGVEKDKLAEENVEALAKGIVNLEKHIENIGFYKIPFVVALNRFLSDSQAEMDYMMNWAKENNCPMALSDVFANGSAGGMELAKMVIETIENKSSQHSGLLYDVDLSIKEKIERIAKKVYGAANVEYSEAAEKAIETYDAFGWNKMPICMAKTPLSLSDDPKKIGRPENFTITIRDMKPSIGAGFLVALTGDVMTMPGLPRNGAFENMDVIDGKIIGLF